MDENPSDPDAIVADARARHRAGDLDAAARLYDSVLARAPDHAEALQLKGILLAQTGDPAAGLELLSRAAELAPESGPIRANLAKLRLDLGEIDAAVADYEAAVDLDPGNADLLFNLGGALALASRRDEAIARLESVRDEGNPHVLANLGNLYR
ncbi:MAG: tetratricopeptide repeat protein, partial [Rhodospirillaceae bacterium]